MDMSVILRELARPVPVVIAGDATRLDALASVLEAEPSAGFWGEAPYILVTTGPFVLSGGARPGTVWPHGQGHSAREYVLASLRRLGPSVFTDLPDDDSRALWLDGVATGTLRSLVTLEAGSIEDAEAALAAAYATLPAAGPADGQGWIRERISLVLVLGGEVRDVGVASR